MYAIFLVAVYYCSYLSQYLVKINTAFHFQDKEEMEMECEERKALQLKLVSHIYLVYHFCLSIDCNQHNCACFSTCSVYHSLLKRLLH